MGARRQHPAPPGYTEGEWREVMDGYNAYNRAHRAGRTPTDAEKAASAAYQAGLVLVSENAVITRLWRDAQYRAAGLSGSKRTFPIDFAARPLSIPTHCPLTGLEISRAKANPRNGGPRRPSIDQINQGEGYVFGNTRIISNFANKARASLSDDEFRAFCLAVTIKAKNEGWTPETVPLRLRHAIRKIGN